MRDRFYDPHLNGLDWQDERARFRPQAASARSREDAAAVINAMLAKLGASHTHYYTPDDPAYYQLADIFAGALEHRGLNRVFPSGDVSYPGIGVFTEGDDQGRTFITGVIEGAPAHEAGVLLGDEIVSADDHPFRPVDSFRGKVGAPGLARDPPRVRRGADRDRRHARRSPPERDVPARPQRRARGSSSRTRPALDTCASGPMRATGCSPRSRT